MSTTWLPGAARTRDLSGFVTNGPFKTLLGVILHVNVDEFGTPISFWGPGNPNSVVPNVQVFKDGSFDQMLPLDRQPWCQIDGNFNYAAIETAGLPSEPLTDAQLDTIARIMRVYHTEYGVPLTIADHPGEPGLGTHEMGGLSWGGHPCPGAIRAAQRSKILDLAQPSTDLLEEIMSLDRTSADYQALLADIVSAVFDHKLTALDGTTAKAGVFIAQAATHARDADKQTEPVVPPAKDHK